MGRNGETCMILIRGGQLGWFRCPNGWVGSRFRRFFRAVGRHRTLIEIFGIKYVDQALFNVLRGCSEVVE